jgi:hypothetical protein
MLGASFLTLDVKKAKNTALMAGVIVKKINPAWGT